VDAAFSGINLIYITPVDRPGNWFFAEEAIEAAFWCGINKKTISMSERGFR
jgi:hypothetical protein